MEAVGCLLFVYDAQPCMLRLFLHILQELPVRIAVKPQRKLALQFPGTKLQYISAVFQCPANAGQACETLFSEILRVFCQIIALDQRSDSAVFKQSSHETDIAQERSRPLLFRGEQMVDRFRVVTGASLLILLPQISEKAGCQLGMGPLQKLRISAPCRISESVVPQICQKTELHKEVPLLALACPHCASDRFPVGIRHQAVHGLAQHILFESISGTGKKREEPRYHVAASLFFCPHVLFHPGEDDVKNVLRLIAE